MLLSWSQITWFAGKAVRTILVPQKRCLVCDHKFKCSCEKKNPVQCKQDIGPGKPGAKKKQLNPSGRVYESSLGFAVSGCLWGDFWQEQGKSPGAACMKQCPLVATWFFHVQNCISTLLALPSWYWIRCCRCMLNMCRVYHVSWSHCCRIEQCCATCLQQDCLICHLCVTLLVLEISVLKATN